MSALLGLLGCGRDEAPQPDVAPAWEAPDASTPLRRLAPAQVDRTLADLFPGAALPGANLPADLEVAGFDGMGEGWTPSPLYVERVQAAAVAVTAAAMDAPGGFLPCPDDGGSDPEACGRQFLADFAARALRRPLSDEDEELFLGFFEEQLAETGQFRVALQLAMQAVLQDVAFLHRIELGDGAANPPRAPLTPHEQAVRLSYLLWGTLPDEALRAEADAGGLRTADQVEAAAWRLLDDDRAEDGVGDFFRLWLDLDEVDRAFAFFGAYPDWDYGWNPRMRREVDQLVQAAWRAEDPTLQALLLDRSTEVDEVLAQIYDLPEGATELPGDTRAGILTRAGWLAAKAHAVEPSPVLRGVFVLDRLLCAPPAPPPPEVDTAIVGLQFGEPATNREVYEQHVTDPACAGCHRTIDPIGFAFEHYDSLGQWRDREDGGPTDASGEITAGDLAGTQMYGAVELSELLAGSTTVRACFARQWARFGIGRMEEDADGALLERLEALSVANGGDLRPLLIELVRSETFRSRRVP